MMSRGDSAPAAGLPKFSMLIGAISSSTIGMTVTYGQALADKPGSVQGGRMTPQEREFVVGQIDLKVADLRSDVRLNTMGLAELKDRFGDLAAKMATVPTDIAAMKRDIAHLPSKDDLSNKLRNWIALGVAIVGAMLAAATLFLKYAPAAVATKF